MPIGALIYRTAESLTLLSATPSGPCTPELKDITSEYLVSQLAVTATKHIAGPDGFSLFCLCWKDTVA